MRHIRLTSLSTPSATLGAPLLAQYKNGLHRASKASRSAAGLGVGPRIPASKAGVIPLHHPAITILYSNKLLISIFGFCMHMQTIVGNFFFLGVLLIKPPTYRHGKPKNHTSE